MRRYLFMLLFFSSHAFAIEAEITALKKALPSADAATINKALVDLNIAIGSSDISDGSSYSNPSPDRLKKRQQTAEALESIKQDIINLTSITDPVVFSRGVPGWDGKQQSPKHADTTIITNATALLGYTSGDQKVYDALRSNLVQGQTGNVVSSALYSLFQTGMADQEVTDIAIKRMESYQNPEDQDIAFNLIHLAAVWPIPDALDFFTEVLKTDNRLGAKISVVKAIIKLGPRGATALPELQNLLQELEQQKGDFRDIDTVKQAIQVVSRKDNQVITQVSNVPATSNSTTTPAKQSKPSASSVPSIQAASAQSSPPWTWGVVGLLLLAVMGGVWWKFLRK
jgi:hypothetical protein